MSLVKIEVDPGSLLARQFTALEQQNLPFAVMQASNRTAFEVRENWKRNARRVFDRPTNLTVNAALFKKATKSNPVAEIFIRDQAASGTAPAQYLNPQVQGGTRRTKGLERMLLGEGLMPSGMLAVPARDARLNASGNVTGGQVRRIIAGLQGGGADAPAPPAGRGRGRRARSRGFFALPQPRGRLPAGIYERVGSGQVRGLFVFVRGVSYQPRFKIFELAQKDWNRLMPFFFERELAKAVENSILRGRAR